MSLFIILYLSAKIDKIFLVSVEFKNDHDGKFLMLGR